MYIYLGWILLLLNKYVKNILMYFLMYGMIYTIASRIYNARCLMKVRFMNFFFIQEMHATIGFGGGCQDAFEVYYCLDTVTQCWNIEQWKKSYFDWNKWILNAFILYKCISTYIYVYIRNNFSSNHNIHKSSCGLCFWTFNRFH